MTPGVTHVAFLRAINVGARRVKMGELADACRDGGVDVRATWQGTGNLLVAAPGRSSSDLAADVEQALVDALDLVSQAVVRTVEEVRSLALSSPFDEAELGATDGRVQVLLVRDAVSPAVRDEVAALVPEDDLVRFVGDDVWWLPRRGVSGSTLRVKAVERLVGVATMRGLRALDGLVAKHLSQG